MSVFTNLEEVRAAALRILKDAPDPKTVRQRIKALPGPSTVGGFGGSNFSDHLPSTRGICFDIPGDVTVRFEDQQRTASFVITQGPDDPSPTYVHLVFPPP